jgi:hypothetical protein
MARLLELKSVATSSMPLNFFIVSVMVIPPVFKESQYPPTGGH